MSSFFCAAVRSLLCFGFLGFAETLAVAPAAERFETALFARVELLEDAALFFDGPLS
ncbi:MAG TPA: hypothetical protein VI031_06765 [Pyrinomonadaceae bacterium]